MLHHAQDTWKIEEDRMGNFTLSIGDKNVYLQGDDAESFQKDMEAAEKADQERPWFHHVENLVSEYSEVME